MGKCVRVTQKKYATRPSPPFHAGDCPWQTMEGNDGRSYKSIKTKSGSHVWIPLGSSGSKGTRKNGKAGKGTKKGKIYNIHDNGNVSYMVEDRPKEKRAVIYNTIGDDDTGRYTIGPKLHEIKYMSIWLGDSAVSELYGDFEKGNTILLQTEANKYVAICRQNIFSFSLEAGEAVSKFVAPIGNNDVPYPYIVGTKNVYLFSELVQIPVELVDMNAEPYIQFYGINEFKGKGLKKKAMAMKYKML